jgi:lipopolysaccharide transport system ATP-binding protein
MGDVMVRVENLGKMYHIGARQERHATLAGSFADSAKTFLRRVANPRLARAGTKNVEELWALRDISFELKRGDVLGIIGRNGSGKSTLLRIISRITAPTEGRVRLWGRVGSLLEVGIGFHPELTGRENVYLSGAILGMRRAEIDRVFDEIVDFAEVEKFIDTPVKHYSSGMYVRLAFAVAAHFDPEMLILDEVLSVGDAAFQKKSLEKMERAAKSGKTVLFVSHALASVSRLCDQGLYLEDGRAVYSGSATEVVTHYLRKIHQIDEERLRAEADKPLPTFLDLRESDKRWAGYSQKILTWVSTHRADGEPCAEFETGDSMIIRVGYHVNGSMNAYCQVNFLDYAGVRVMQLHSTHGNAVLNLQGEGHIDCVLHDLRLLAGNYTIMLEIGDSSSGKPKWLDCIGDTIHIKVNLGRYLGGVGLSQAQVVFAQRSAWNLAPDSTSSIRAGDGNPDR